MVMKRTLTIIIVATVGLAVWRPAIAQSQNRAQMNSPGKQLAQADAKARAQYTRPIYLQHDTWYELLLKQFNPDDFDYGAWIEERRQVFLEASVRNPYFKYSAGITLALLIMAMLYAKQWMDHRRSMWITAEMMTDLYNHDAHSRRFAREAIEKYNAHIERCNRAVEAGEQGLPVAGADSEAARLRSELASVRDERDSLRRDRDLAKDDLAEKERLLADISLRLDALGKKTDANRNLSGPVDMHTADQKLVQHINNLQEQLYAAQRENKRLKGER